MANHRNRVTWERNTGEGTWERNTGEGTWERNTGEGTWERNTGEGTWERNTSVNEGVLGEEMYGFIPSSELMS